MPDPQLLARAVALLARRAHSAAELRRKLLQKGAEIEALPALFEELERLGYLDDAAFAAAFARSRSERGFGPRRIAADLQARGLERDRVESVLADLEVDWSEMCRRALGRKPLARSRGPEQARQQRFLAQRGFTADQIRSLYRAVDDQ